MAKKRQTSTGYDSPWKKALQLLLQPFLEFFFSDIAADIDWSRGYESLDKELQKIARRAKIGTRLADKLFKVWRSDGTEHWLLLHIEVQTDYDEAFAERMFQYNVAAYQMYNKEVISLAVLGDDRPNWRPTRFAYGQWGCETGVTFRIAKLLDYADDLAGLEASDNPFAAVALAHAKTRQTRQDPLNRKFWKLRIAKGLYQRQWSKEMIALLFDLIDEMMRLPEELEEAFAVDLADFEEEINVRYVNSVERVLLQKAREEGLLEGIGAVLEAKFGKSGMRLLPKVRTLEGGTRLRAFLEFLSRAETLAEVRDHLG